MSKNDKKYFYKTLAMSNDINKGGLKRTYTGVGNKNVKNNGGESKSRI
jgi:hypothetical protein